MASHGAPLFLLVRPLCFDAAKCSHVTCRAATFPPIPVDVNIPLKVVSDNALNGGTVD